MQLRGVPTLTDLPIYRMSYATGFMGSPVLAFAIWE